MNKDNPISMALKAIKDENTRSKALAVLGAFGAAAVIAAVFLYSIMTERGCSAGIPIASAIVLGLFALAILGAVWFIGGFILYSSFHLPGFIREMMDDRRQDWYLEMKREQRENRKPLSVRIKTHFAENWRKWLAVPAFVGGLALFSYTIAYLAWLAFC